MKISRISRMTPLGIFFWGSVGSMFGDVQYSFVTISPLNLITNVYAINNSDQIVGTVQGYPFPAVGALLSSDSYTPLDMFPRTINNEEEIVGFGSNGAGILFSGDVYTSLPVTLPTWINDSGEIGGGFGLFSGGVVSSTNDPDAGSTNTNLTGISNSGQIVGIAFTSSRPVPVVFLYSGGGYTQIDGLGSLFIVGPVGINDSDQIVGTYSVSNPFPPPVNLHRGFVATPAVPEPRSLPTVAGCLLGLLALRRKSALARPK
jgi:hypothetical protein